MRGFYLLSIAAILVSGQDVAIRFKQEEVAGAPGGVLSEAPENLLEVRYEEQEVAADLGNSLPVSKTQSQPRATFPEAKASNKYTLGELRHNTGGKEIVILGITRKRYENQEIFSASNSGYF